MFKRKIYYSYAVQIKQIPLSKQPWFCLFNIKLYAHNHWSSPFPKHWFVQMFLEFLGNSFTFAFFKLCSGANTTKNYSLEHCKAKVLNCEIGHLENSNLLIKILELDNLDLIQAYQSRASCFCFIHNTSSNLNKIKLYWSYITTMTDLNQMYKCREMDLK